MMRNAILFIAALFALFVTGFDTPGSDLNDNPFDGIQLEDAQQKHHIGDWDYSSIVLHVMEISTYAIICAVIIGLILYGVGTYQTNPQLKRNGRMLLITCFSVWILLLLLPYVIVHLFNMDTENPFPFTVMDIVDGLSFIAVVINFIMILHAANRLMIAAAEKNPDSKQKAMNALLTHGIIVVIAIALPPVGNIII